jgi:hypothetical protein
MFSLALKNDSDINKEERQSPSTQHPTGGRPVSIGQPAAYSQEVMPWFNNHFLFLFWQEYCKDRRITFYIFVINL